MKGESLSLDEVLEDPPELPRSSPPPRGVPSDAPTGRYRAVARPEDVLGPLPSVAPSPGRRSAPPPRPRPSSRAPRRRRRLGAYATFLGWAAVLVALGFFASAQPPTSYTFFQTFGGAGVRRHWDEGDLVVALALAGVGWSLCAGALVLDALETPPRLNKPAVVALLAASFLLVNSLALL